MTSTDTDVIDAPDKTTHAPRQQAWHGWRERRDPCRVCTARRYVMHLLKKHGHPPEQVGIAAQILSELAANAVTHGVGPWWWCMVCSSTTGEVRLEIGSDLPTTEAACVPQPAALGEDAEHGRGLLLVDELADRWGVRHEPGRCWVWATLDPPP